jgi:lysozyme
MIEGIIDLSHWQSSVNLQAYVKSGGLAVFLKATQGSTWVDPTFTARVLAATQAGLLVGAYHFCDATSPAAQVTHFMAVAGKVTKVLAIDVENNGMGETVSIAQAAEIAVLLQSATGRLPLVYISRYGPTGNGAGLPNSVLMRCPLWLPKYGTDPICPPGWMDWTFWQYTDEGSADGVESPCDMNRFNGTVLGLNLWWNA